MQKFIWSGRAGDKSYCVNNVNKIKGVVGEGMVYKHFVTDQSVIAGTTKNEAAKLLLGPIIFDKQQAGKALSASLKTQINYKLHDRGADLTFSAKASEKMPFHHPFVRMHGNNSIFSVSGPQWTEEKYKKDTNFVYEIKTNKVDEEGIYTSRNLATGLR